MANNIVHFNDDDLVTTMNLTQNEIDINFNDDDNFFMEKRLIYTREQITIYSLLLVPRYNRLRQDIFPRQ